MRIEWSLVYKVRRHFGWKSIFPDTQIVAYPDYLECANRGYDKLVLDDGLPFQDRVRRLEESFKAV